MQAVDDLADDGGIVRKGSVVLIAIGIALLALSWALIQMAP